MARRRAVETDQQVGDVAQAVATTPMVKTVTFTQIEGVAQMTFKGLKGDAYAEARRKINDARNLVRAVYAWRVAVHSGDNRSEQLKKNAQVVAGVFKQRYNVQIV